MKFEEVLPALRDGKKIRRKSWEPHPKFIRFNEEFLNNDGFPFSCLSSSAIMADDWEIVEDKKEKLKELIQKLVNGVKIYRFVENLPTGHDGSKELDLFAYIDTLEIN